MTLLKLSRILTVVLAVAILVASLLPQHQTPDPLHLDKVEHLGAYALLGFLAYLAAGRRGLGVVLAVIALCSVFGGLIEIVQPLTGRSRELADWIVDIAGASLGSLLGGPARRILDRRARVG